MIKILKDKTRIIIITLIVSILVLIGNFPYSVGTIIYFVICGAISYHLARKINKNVVTGYITGFILGVLGILLYYLYYKQIKRKRKGLIVKIFEWEIKNLKNWEDSKIVTEEEKYGKR